MAKLKKKENLLEQAENEIDDLKEKVQDYKQNIVDYIQDNPFTTVALALTAGVLLGTYWNATHGKK